MVVMFEGEVIEGVEIAEDERVELARTTDW